MLSVGPSPPQIAAVVVLLVSFFLAGCTTGAPRFEDPLAVMLDRERSLESRQAAFEQARQAAHRESYVETLNTLAWRWGHPVALRKAAINELIRLDEAAFREVLPRRIKATHDWETIGYICEVVAQRGWTDATGAIVRSWSRPSMQVADVDRPERRTLAKLHPGVDPEDTVFAVFVDRQNNHGLVDEVDAWALLCRWHEDVEDRAALLRRADSDSSLLDDLRAGWRDLGVLPAGREGVLWLLAIRSQRSFWQRARAVVSELEADQRAGLGLRHLPILVSSDAVDRRRSRHELMRRIERRLAGADHVMVELGPSGRLAEPQTLAAHQDAMAWADLLVLDRLHAFVFSPSVSPAGVLFGIAHADVADQRTEYGGVIEIDAAGGLAIVPHDPVITRHDRMFVPPPTMILDLYTAAAHYHMHAQEEKQVEYAAPGTGDLRVADRLGFTGLVFTLVGRDRLNVDYYQPGQVVVDLGTLRR